MSLRETTIRHQLVINRLRQRPYSWKEIDAFLREASVLQEYKLFVSQRTFQRDMEDILSTYGILIYYNAGTKKYHLSDEDKESNRYLEAFDVFNLLKAGGNQAEFVSFEKRRPQGTQHLYGLLHAIRHQVCVSFKYHKYYETGHEIRTVEPYALKEAKNRWYLVCRDTEKEALRVFALDRMGDLKILDRKYKVRNDMDAESLFRSCFGIILPEQGQQQEEIILSFTPFQGKYIKSLPLHESQRVLIDNDQELQVSLHMYVTHDFVMELLSYGDRVRVLKPEPLRQKMIESCKNTLHHYDEAYG